MPRKIKISNLNGWKSDVFFLSISLLLDPDPDPGEQEQYGQLDPSRSRSEIFLRPNSWTKSKKISKVFLLAIHSHLHSFA
jgi:hypothetical protein